MDGELITTPDLYQKLGDECFKVHAIYKTDAPDRYYAMVKFGDDVYRADFAVNDGNINIQRMEGWYFE